MRKFHFIEIQENGINYEIWFDYVLVEDEDGNYVDADVYKFNPMKEVSKDAFEDCHGFEVTEVHKELMRKAALSISKK